MTLILVGWKVSGSVTYTSVGATLRGYTVVVPSMPVWMLRVFRIVLEQLRDPLNQNSANAWATSR